MPTFCLNGGGGGGGGGRYKKTTLVLQLPKFPHMLSANPCLHYDISIKISDIQLANPFTAIFVNVPTTPNKIQGSYQHHQILVTFCDSCLVLYSVLWAH